MTAPKPWWERRPGLYQRELDAFAGHGLDLQVDETAKANGRLILTGVVPAGRLGDIEIAVVYPGTFPHTRPTVYQLTGQRLDRHQNPIKGNYCLIGRSSDYWQPSTTAAELVSRLPELVGLVDEGGQTLHEAEDPQGEPASTYYDYPAYGGVIVPPEALQLPDGAYTGQITVRFRNSTWLEQLLTDAEVTGFAPALLTHVTNQDGATLAAADERLQRLFGGPEWTGHWVRVDQFPATGDPSSLLRKLADTTPQVLTPGRHKSAGHHFAIHAAVADEEIQQGVYGPGWVFAATAARVIHAKQPSGVQLVRGMRYSRRQLTQRIPELSAVADATVGIVGLGTLGAPIARQLAQSQTGHLKLIDPDYVDAATTVRWPGGIQAAGVHKALYLAAEIQHNHPYVDVTAQGLSVGHAPLEIPEGQTDDYTTLWHQIENADLVIEATAEDNVSRAVSEIADELALPQIYVYSVEGYGGVVARIIPDETGCFHCLSLHLSPDRGEMPAPPSPPEDHVTRVQPPGCDEPTFTAAAAELLPLSVQTTRVAYSTLTAGTGSAYTSITDDVFVLSLRDGSGQMLSAPRWETHPLDVHPECERH